MAWEHAGNQDTGNWWTNEELGVSAFEDRQAAAFSDDDADDASLSAWYAWRGTPADHDRAEQTATYATLDEALGAIPSA